MNEFLNGHYNIVVFAGLVGSGVSVNEFLNGHYNIKKVTDYSGQSGFSERIPKWPLQHKYKLLLLLFKAFGLYLLLPATPYYALHQINRVSVFPAQ